MRLRWSAASVTGSHGSLLIVHAATALYLAWIGSQIGMDRTQYVDFKNVVMPVLEHNLETFG